MVSSREPLPESTSSVVRADRGTQGVYAKARRGELRGFTGVDDPYEPPPHPEIMLGMTGRRPEENAREIVRLLIERGYLIT